MLQFLLPESNSVTFQNDWKLNTVWKVHANSHLMTAGKYIHNLNLDLSESQACYMLSISFVSSHNK